MKSLEQVVEQLKNGRFSELENGKSMVGDEIGRLKRYLEESERQIDELSKENQRMKNE